ncbi:hypothetical protein FRB96_009491, partial [Tulasnella sp. 330]
MLRRITRVKQAAPYLVGGTKITLDILSKGTRLIHPPCVTAAIEMATRVIAVVEGVKANRDDTRLLIERVLGLIAIMTTIQETRAGEELRSDVRNSIQRLTTDLDEIRGGLVELLEGTDPRRFGSSMRGIFLYVENGKKIKGYSSQLSWAMDVFQVEGNANNAIRLWQIADDTTEVRVLVREMHAIVMAIKPDARSSLEGSSDLGSDDARGAVTVMGSEEDSSTRFGGAREEKKTLHVGMAVAG